MTIQQKVLVLLTALIIGLFVSRDVFALALDPGEEFTFTASSYRNIS